MAQGQAAVVTAGPKQIPGLPVGVSRGGDRAADQPVSQGRGAGSGVEGVDVDPGPSQHQRVVAGGAGLGPVMEDAVEGGVTIRARVEPAGRLVCREDRRVALAELQGGLAFPVGGEPVDLTELDTVPGVR